MFCRHFDVIKSRFLAIFVIFRVLFIFKATYSPLEFAMRQNNIAYYCRKFKDDHDRAIGLIIKDILAE